MRTAHDLEGQEGRFSGALLTSCVNPSYRHRILELPTTTALRIVLSAVLCVFPLKVGFTVCHTANNLSGGYVSPKAKSAKSGFAGVTDDLDP